MDVELEVKLGESVVRTEALTVLGVVVDTVLRTVVVPICVLTTCRTKCSFVDRFPHRDINALISQKLYRNKLYIARLKQNPLYNQVKMGRGS